MSAPDWVHVAKNWATGATLTEDSCITLSNWAVALATARGTWLAVSVELRDEAGLSNLDAEDLAFQIRLLIHLRGLIDEAEWPCLLTPAGLMVLEAGIGERS